MKLIRDAIHGLIEVDYDTLKVISTSLFQRLRYITQNGMAYLVYPSMRHSRFEHSLGSYHISKLILENFSFDENTKREIKLLALLHDIGHLPFSHTFEFSLPLARYEFEKIFRRISVRSIEKVHEAVGYYILSQYFKMNDIAELFKDIYLPNTEEEEVKFRILRLFINSSFDVDRLHYPFRDSYYAGVVYGKLSIDRLINFISIRDGYFVFPEKTAEDIGVKGDETEAEVNHFVLKTGESIPRDVPEGFPV